MKIFIKITIFSLLIIIIFGSLNCVYAAPTKGTDGSGGGGTTSKQTNSQEVTEHKKADWGDVFDLGDKFIKEGKEGPTGDNKDDNDVIELKIDEEELKDSATNIFNMILAIGTVLTVIVGGILGIKFMFAGVEEKAKIKEAIIPYILGCIVIFGAVGIWKFVVTILDSM